MEIQKVTDISFQKYGKLVREMDCSKLLKEMKHTPMPNDVTYVPSMKRLEDLEVAEEFQNRMYGGLPIQIGYCNGHNETLNAVEYHRCSEVDVAVDDIILLLGRQQDIKEDFTYDTSKVKAFLVPAGTLVEVYATTLHYAPCQTADSGFRCVVVLPRGTNTDLDHKPQVRCGEEKLITARNKWLIGHEEGGLDEGAWIGLKGENISL